jgi:hypothetical protein
MRKLVYYYSADNNNQINGENVFWMDNRYGKWDIYMLNLYTHTENGLPPTQQQWFPKVYVIGGMAV